MNEEKKYTLASNWVIRYEEKMEPHGLAYNIYSDTKVAISKPLYYILRLLKYSTLSISELHEAIHGQQSKEILTNVLFHNSALVDILVESNKTNTEDFIETTSCKFIDKFNIAIASYPFDAEIHFTEKCNLRCKHCGYDCSSESSLKEIEYFHWVNLFDQFEKNGLLKLAISGGEPFFYYDIVNVLKGLQNRKFRIEFLTNSILIKEQYLQYLTSPNMGFNISLDGADKESHEYLRGKNTFYSALKSIKLLNEIGAKINISATIHKQNLAQIEKLVCFVIQNKVSSINFILLDKIGRAKNNQDLHFSVEDRNLAINTITNMQQKYKNDIVIAYIDPINPQYNYLSKKVLNNNSKIYCSAATNRIAVSADGNVYPCVYGYDLKERKGGNITDKTISEIWQTEKWDIFRGKVTFKELNQCQSCLLANSCTLVICRLKAQVYSNDFYGIPYSCPKIL